MEKGSIDYCVLNRFHRNIIIAFSSKRHRGREGKSEKKTANTQEENGQQGRRGVKRLERE